MSKNLSIILYSILFVAVAVLYVLHFTSNRGAGQSASTMLNDSVIAKMPEGGIVYVNSDTLLNRYDLYFEMKKQLTDKQKVMENDFVLKSTSHEKKVADYQGQMQKGLLLRSEAEKIEQNLMIEQQNLMKLRDKLTMELAEEEQVMNRKLINSIVEYLKEFNANGKYTYVLSYAFGSNLLFAPDSLDITKAVLSGLNDKYKAEKKAGNAK